jgi:hypothetical protein
MRDLLGAIKDAVIYDGALSDVVSLATLLGLCYLLLIITP